MTKKKIKELAQISYSKNNLDEKKAYRITNLLNRKELKQYLKELKKIESKKSVEIILSKTPTKKSKKMFENLFPDKKIIYNIDKSLMLGVRITNNDLIYEMSLKNTFQNLVSHLTHFYDRQ